MKEIRIVAMKSTVRLFAVSAAVLLFSGLVVTVVNPRRPLLLFRRGDSGAAEAVPIDGAFGPESFAFDPQGDGPYTGVSDGRIIKWVEEERRWIDFAYTSPNREQCEGRQDHEATEHISGRPLGLGFNQNTGELYVADPYMGLLAVAPGGGTEVVAAGHVRGGSLGFANGLDIDQRDGTVYFSDSSAKYCRRDHISLIVTGDRTGRLMKYDPDSKRVEVLLRSLAFPNGVVVTPDGSSVLISETGSCRVLRYCLRTGATSVFADLPGFPDNIKRSPRGGYWVGIFMRRSRLLEWLLSYPEVGSALIRAVPNGGRVGAWYGRWRARGFAVRLSEEGEVVEVLEGKTIGRVWKSVSEVLEKGTEDGRGNKFWVGSVNMPFAWTFLR